MAHVPPFERPVELLSRVRDLRDLAEKDERYKGELERLEERTARLAREVFSKLSLSRHPPRSRQSRRYVRQR